MANVMIVDDAMIVRKHLTTMLQNEGHTVVAEASHGLQAYCNYERYRPDVVTMDVNMPGMNGLETIEKIIKDFPDARIVVVSAFGTKTVILDALQRGAKNYILKPISQEKVAQAVKEALAAECEQ
ncbi:MAG TPA: response regulator [Patescibacteria group bacterium]|nr:response regulator [Patescibacteria group bacterium]